MIKFAQQFYHCGHTISGAYDNFGQNSDEFYDADDIWNHDKYYKLRKSKRQSTRNPKRDIAQTSKTNQNHSYDSWKTEWSMGYNDQYRSGPSGASNHSADVEKNSGGSRATYMTKGGARLAYEDDF